MSKECMMEERKRDFIFVLNEEQQQWVDKDDEEPLFLHVHTWDGLKGISSPDRCVCRGEGHFGIISGVSSCVSVLPVREGCFSHQGRATVWASHLQLINSYTLILTADHN